jgi:hypothetical protein
VSWRWVLSIVLSLGGAFDRRISMVLSNLVSSLPLDSMPEMLGVSVWMKLYVANKVDFPCMVHSDQ